MLEWSLSEDDDLTDTAVVKRANPASFVTQDFLAEQLAAPGLHPPDFASYHANVWTDAADAWLTAGAWQACAADYAIEPGETVWLGVDIGGQRSASAVAWVTEDLRVGASIYQGEEAIFDCIAKVRELAADYEVREVTTTPALPEGRARTRTRRAPRRRLPPIQHRMVPASERLYAAVKDGRLRHPNHPELNQHIAAVVARQTERGVRIDKARSRDQVDGAIALAMALERAEAKPEPVELVGWLVKPCLRCGRLTPAGSYCAAHQPAPKRKTSIRPWNRTREPCCSATATAATTAAPPPPRSTTSSPSPAAAPTPQTTSSRPAANATSPKAPTRHPRPHERSAALCAA